MTALKKLIREDYQTLCKQLALKANKISKGLRIEEDKKDKIFFVSGQYNYSAILLIFFKDDMKGTGKPAPRVNNHPLAASSYSSSEVLPPFSCQTV